MTLFQAFLAILWPITGLLQALALAPEMFLAGLIKFIVNGHL